MNRLSIRSAAGHAAALVGTFSIGFTLIASPAIATEGGAIPTISAELQALSEESIFASADISMPTSEVNLTPSTTNEADDLAEIPSATIDYGVEIGSEAAIDDATTGSGSNEESDFEQSPSKPLPDSVETPADTETGPASNDANSDGLASNMPGDTSTVPPTTPENDPLDDRPDDDGIDTPADSSITEIPRNTDDVDQNPSDIDPDATPIDLEASVATATIHVSRGELIMVARDGAFTDSWGVSFKVSNSGKTQWVGATRQSDGSWSATLSLSSLGSGTASIEAWAHLGSSPANVYASTSASIPATGAKLSMAYDSERARFVLSAKDVSCPTGVSFISIGLTSPSGTTRWYRLDSQANGSWAIDIDPTAFGWESGTYTLVGSICDASWAAVACGTTKSTVSFGTETVHATLTNDGRIQLEAAGGRYAEAWGVSFAVSSSQGTTWIPAKRQVDGGWYATTAVPSSSDASLEITAWANVASSPAFAPASTTLAVPASSATLSLAYDAEQQRLALQATNVTCPSGVTFISVGATSPKGTTLWYRLTQQDDGSWATWINPNDYAWQSGTYTLAGSICDAQWAGIATGTTTAAVSYGTETLSAASVSDGSKVHITAAGGRYDQAWNVSFQISGPSQTSWVAGTHQPDGSWTIDASGATWGGGKLTIAAYAALGNSTLLLGSTQVVTASQTAVFSCAPQPNDDTIMATAMGGAFSTATNVAFEVYNLGEDRGNTSWYQAHKQPDGSWSAQIPADIQGVGTCIATAWATNNGSTTAVADARYTYSVDPTIVSEIELGSGGYDVSYGMSGLKVQRIQQALGIGNPTYPRYLSETEAAVRNFQNRTGLPATGVVDRTTWLSLGLNDQEWYTLGAYASPVRVGANATAAERIEAMIGRAHEYLGDPYVWDAAGAPGQGVDCAGLVMQSLYAAGLSTGIINPITHATTSWGDHDASNYYNYGGFTKTSLSDRVRGDLIYYGTNNAIDHIAIYLGNDQIIEAYPGSVRLSSLWKASIFGVTRVFS